LSVFKALWTSWFNSLLGIKVGVQGFGGPSWCCSFLKINPIPTVVLTRGPPP